MYNVNSEQTDPTKEYRKVKRAFKKAAFTIKDGEIVVKDGKITRPVFGKTLWVDVKTSLPTEINEDIKQKFRDYWTVEHENYPIPNSFLHVPAPIPVKAEV